MGCCSSNQNVKAPTKGGPIADPEKRPVPV